MSLTPLDITLPAGWHFNKEQLRLKPMQPLWKIYRKFLTGGVGFSKGLAYRVTLLEIHTPSVLHVGKIYQR